MGSETRTVAVDDYTVSAVFNEIRREAWIRTLIPAEGDHTTEWEDPTRTGVNWEQRIAREEGETCVEFAGYRGPGRLEQAQMYWHDKNYERSLLLTASREGETWQKMILSVTVPDAVQADPFLDLAETCSSNSATWHALLHLVSIALMAPDGKAPASE